MLHDHMMKAKRLTNFYLPYVVFISKFLEYFEVDVEDELQETTGAQNHICRLNLHKMGFTKVNNNWTTERNGSINWTNNSGDGPSVACEDDSKPSGA